MLRAKHGGRWPDSPDRNQLTEGFLEATEHSGRYQGVGMSEPNRTLDPWRAWRPSPAPLRLPPFHESCTSYLISKAVRHTSKNEPGSRGGLTIEFLAEGPLWRIFSPREFDSMPLAARLA